MDEEPKKTYNVKLQDFTPFVGWLFYSGRNWKDEQGNRRHPQPYFEYNVKGAALTALDFFTGTVGVYTIYKGLEGLIS
jgi:hypothetical protein